MIRRKTIQLLLSALSGGMLIWVIVMYIQIGGNITEKPELLQGRSNRNLGLFNIERPNDEARNRLVQEAMGHRHHDLPVNNARNMENSLMGHKLQPFTLKPPDQSTDRLKLPAEERFIAVGLGITTRGLQDVREDRIPTELPFFTRLLSSFCRTCSYGFVYRFYMAHDFNDPYFHFNQSHANFNHYFIGFISRNCPQNVNVSLELVKCDHSGNPAWAQNDAMMQAYFDNAAYFYRVNDDTVLESTGWTEKFIEQLLRYSPRNVGVAGPWFRDGNIAILTHDFVHRTHVDIFGSYYPRIFTDWFADDWITGVYWPERARKVSGTLIKHTMEMGNRYVVHFEKASRVHIEVDVGKILLNRYIKSSLDGVKAGWSKDDNNVVVMSLIGSDPTMIYGVMRYAQLMPIMMEGWRLRIYVEDSSSGEEYIIYKPVKKKLLAKLEHFGVEIIRLDNETVSKLPPDMWPLLAADDSNIERLLIRDPKSRPSEREMMAVKLWTASKKVFHCIRDHPKHAKLPLIPTLIGAMPQYLRTILSKSMKSLMRGYTAATQFLNEEFWPLIKERGLCHDSVSCKHWGNAKPYPMLRMENEYVGQPYDEDDMPTETTDSRLWSIKYSSPDCVHILNTGFKELAVKKVIQYRPVLWSQDFHVMPVMDIKSLLKPIGVKVLDKSLSYYCGQVGTCARGLKVITRTNGMELSPETIQLFYETYRSDSEMQQVTAFVCTLPAAMCEAFIPFNKSIIVISNIRYEQGRLEKDKWLHLNKNLKYIASNPRNVIAANNMYDQKYIEYFTGIKPILVPNACNYLKDSYQPKRKHFLVTPIHNTELSEKWYTNFDEVTMKLQVELQVMPLRQMYPQYLFGDLASHPGIIYVPYQVSLASFSEQYRMNIPMFFPTRQVLTRWHIEYQVVRQRTWDGYYGKKGKGSVITGVLKDIPDPNIDVDYDAVFYWMQFADFYQWPHLIYYSSMEDLVTKMVKTNLTAVSESMKEHNKLVQRDIKNVWSDILLRITTGIT